MINEAKPYRLAIKPPPKGATIGPSLFNLSNARTKAQETSTQPGVKRVEVHDMRELIHTRVESWINGIKVQSLIDRIWTFISKE